MSEDMNQKPSQNGTGRALEHEPGSVRGRQAWYWRPLRTRLDYEQARARLRELVKQSLVEGPVGRERQGAAALLSELLERYVTDQEFARACEHGKAGVAGAVVLAQMERLGLSCTGFARHIGVPHSRVSEVLSGVRPMSRAFASALLEAGAPELHVLAALVAPVRTRATDHELDEEPEGTS